MSIRMVNAVLAKTEIEWAGSGTMTPSDVLLLIAMADFADDKGGNIYPSMKTLAARSMLSPDQARRRIAKLVDDGYVKIVAKGGWRGGKNFANEYRLLPKLWADVGTGILQAPQSEGMQTYPQHAGTVPAKRKYSTRAGASTGTRAHASTVLAPMQDQPSLDPSYQPSLEDGAPTTPVADATPPPFQPANDGAEKQQHLTPDPSPSGEGKKTPTPQQEMFQALCDAVGWDPALLTVEQRGQVGQTMAALQKAGYTLDEVCRFRPEVWAHDWRWTKNKSYPTLNQVRSEIAKVRKTDSRGGSGQGGNSGGDNRLSEEDVAAIRRQREERRRRQSAAADAPAVPALLGHGMGAAGRADDGRTLWQGVSMQV